MKSTGKFYHEVFNKSVVYEDDQCAMFDFGNIVINLMRMEASHELIAPAVVAERSVGSQFMFTIKVDNVDAVCAELEFEA